ncbi:uncharacterized protein LOC126810107 isoform X1 [Patella vulgata]|uniref:uncharacterized protein LOC126810107 isoform X1 n=2 Tax=Patella vulgata TaxID=6465 RepID=UPI00217F9598|nr:uncharacterized protein LOC126810107 isoform X1 [Patella vulgata]
MNTPVQSIRVLCRSGNITGIGKTINPLSKSVKEWKCNVKAFSRSSRLSWTNCTTSTVSTARKSVHHTPVVCQKRNYSVNATDNLDILLDPNKSQGKNVDNEALFQSVMRKVPQAVVIVTSAKENKETGGWTKRGITCSSFTSVSFKPPMLSFCIHRHSRMHGLLQETEKFAVHVLAQDQIRQSLHFAKSWEEESCPFDTIPHVQNEEGLPIIMGSVAVLLCDTHSIHTVGDHHVYYGNLKHGSVSHSLQDPLLYFVRSFRSIGDQVFLQAFEDTTLPFEEWTHEAHLRMAWNYIKQYGKDKATQYIKLGIQKFNEKNLDKIKTGYHETITMFFIHLVTDAINSKDMTFEEFIHKNPHLQDNSLLFTYYSKEVLSSEAARHRFIQPDKKSLP